MRLAFLASSLALSTGCSTDRDYSEALMQAEPTCLRDRVDSKVTLRGSLEHDGKLGCVLVHEGGRIVFEGADQIWVDNHAHLFGHRVEVTSVIGFSYAPPQYVSEDGSFGCPEWSYFFVPAWTTTIRRVDR
jgi:hypothetical protein